MLAVATMSDIAIALIAATPATIAAVLAFLSNRSSKKVHAEVVTNHGIRAGTRLEALGADHEQVKADLSEIKEDMNFVLRWIKLQTSEFEVGTDVTVTEVNE